jgi:glycosyltransferase involved in cell wall biosynthesis
MIGDRTVDVIEPAQESQSAKVSDLVPVLQSRPRPRAPVLRIALVVEAAGGGVAVHIADMVRGLRAMGGFEIHLIVPEGARLDADVINEDVVAQCDTFHRLPMQRPIGGSDVVAFARLFGCLREINPHIVHSHSSKAGALARLCIGPWKQIYTPHAVYTLNPYLPRAQRRFYGLIERFLGVLRSDRVIAVSVDEARHLQEVLRIPAKRVETIFNGIPAPALMPRVDARDALGLPRNAVVVGFVGRLDFQKGVDRLARVAQSMLDRKLDQVIFAVIGPGDFVAAAELDAEDIPGNLRVLGPIPQARRYFSAFDIFALPSRYEGFPYVALEAVAASIPIVSTRVSGAAELIDAEQTGLVVPNEDDTSLFAEAVAALVQDPQACEYMSRNCERAARRFSCAAMLERTVDLYERLVMETA